MALLVAWPSMAELAISSAEATRALTKPSVASGAIAWALPSAQLAEVPSAFKELSASFASRCSSLTMPKVQLESCSAVLAFTTLDSC